ncbi:MAG: sigma-70 family RNA polymerase sigma factor [Deltaproteobacteria bacterium]|nr:sigma-70 family RNA polymerase sigma factor [Deltaproteobacteria bacterium]
MQNPPTDEDLMDAVRDGSEDAYGALFERYRAPLYGFSMRMTRHRETADDVFQETFLRVYRARSTWSHQDGSFRSWLFRIAVNTIRDRARAAARRPEVLGDDWEPAYQGAPDDRIALERALAALPDNLRDAFLLGAVAGLDHNEVAGALGVSPDNARARISRARSRLRELLEES